MPATTILAAPHTSDAEKDAWVHSVLGINAAAAGGPDPVGKAKRAASPALPAGAGNGAPPGKSGLNFVRQLVGGATFPMPFLPGVAGGGIGVGYGQNAGKSQYFLVVRANASGTPKASTSLSAESVMSSSPILGRSVLTRTFTAAATPASTKTGTGTFGPVAASDQVGLTGSHFSNTNKLNVLFGGVSNTVTFKDPKIGKGALNITGSLQAVDNRRRKPGATDADAVKQVEDGVAALKSGKRPIEVLDKDMPSLFTISASLSTAPRGTMQTVLPVAASYTITIPVNKDKVPDWVKDLLQRIAKAQSSPNPKDLLRLLQDIEASPQLRKRLLDWELEELKHIPAPQPVPIGPHRPVHGPSLAPTLIPDPGWATRVGHSLRDAAANWRPPTPAQQAEATLATALAALGAFIIANPEILLVMAL